VLDRGAKRSVNKGVGAVRWTVVLRNLLIIGGAV